MDILLTAHRFHPHVGGTELAVERLARAFVRRGHAATVATMAEPGAPEEEDLGGIRVRRFAMRAVGKFRFPPRAYREFVMGGPWDVVHVHGQRVWSSDYLYRHFARVPAPLVFTAHGFYQWHMERTPLLDAAYYKGVLPRALARCACVTALTENERAELVSFGVAPARIALVPDGFDPDEFADLPKGFRERHGFAPDEPLLLYVGGFYGNKRVDRLVEVAAKTGARLVVIGKDQDPKRGRPYCEALAARLGARVAFLGTLPRDDVLAAFRECDVLLLGSDFEGYGLVLLEAMASGLPFVSTPAGAAPDLARHGCGRIGADADALAAHVRALLADPAERRRMGDAGRAAVGAYEWARVADQYLAIFEEVARR